MGRTIEEIRLTAYRTLHLLYIVQGNGTYRILSRFEPGCIPKLVEYVSFHHKTTLIRMKDTGSEYIYLVNPAQFRRSRLQYLLKMDDTLESRLKDWFPFLWGEGPEEESQKYASLMRSLDELAALKDPLP